MSGRRFFFSDAPALITARGKQLVNVLAATERFIASSFLNALPTAPLASERARLVRKRKTGENLSA